MAHYISINADLRSVEDVIAILQGLLTTSDVGIASICSFRNCKNGASWLLSGFAVETLIDRCLHVSGGNTARIYTLNEPQRNEEYLNQMAQIISRGNRKRESSPFETMKGNFTFIDRSINIIEHSMIRTWFQQAKVTSASAYLFARKGYLGARMPFRHRFIDKMFEPVMEVRLAKHPRAGFTFNLYSASRIWLKADYAPNLAPAHVADFSLRVLTHVVETSLLPLDLTDLAVGLSGSAFHSESGRLFGAFDRFRVTEQIR